MESVYPQEKIDYDGSTYHDKCFKCTQCRSTLSLTAVAMIKGTLYCKTCFKKIFLKAGKYSDFDGGNLSKDELAKLAEDSQSPSAGHQSTPSTDLSNLSLTDRRRSSLGTSLNPCVVPECKTPRVTGKIVCENHANLQNDEHVKLLQPLIDAIEVKNSEKVKEWLKSNPIELLFSFTSRGVTPIEFAFTGVRNSRAQGQILLDAIREKLQS